AVLINLGAAPQTVTLSLSGTTVARFTVARQSTAAAPWADLGPITLGGNVATLNLPAQSITTLQGIISPPVNNNASIAGTLFNDADADGALDAGEARLAGRTVYIDANHNGVKDA